MNKQEKLAELHNIRTTLDKVTKKYCVTPEERKTVKEISLRLFTEQILPLAEELTKELVKETENLVKSYTTSGVQLIDLGLPSNTLWTDRNIGAAAPEHSGEYFRFGETTPFTEGCPKYINKNLGDCIAGTENDTATVILGEKFQKPTLEQIKELLDCCKWEWTTLNGVNGMKVTGPNGNSIFLPASGQRNSSSGSLSYVGSYGYYWSASADDGNGGHYLYFNSGIWYWDNDSRAYGFPVRAVSEEC